MPILDLFRLVKSKTGNRSNAPNPKSKIQNLKSVVGHWDYIDGGRVLNKSLTIH
ncbi:MAG: hypothetical protein V7L27_17690 [Nostoc sp.]|uniref:hypothetical protein n=1 Tax=Nostoc sp. TaxID=1180 RepID=UPI002FFC194A